MLLAQLVEHTTFNRGVTGSNPVWHTNKNKKRKGDIMSQYVITDGSRWITKNRNGKYVPTTCVALADIFGNKEANSIYNNNLSKALKFCFRVEKVDKPPELIKQITYEDTQENTESVSLAENIQYWVDKVNGLNGLASEALHRKNKLLNQLSNADKEISDLLHYIEFCNLNAAQGYKAYKMIKERRIKRRSIKNELDVLNIILSKKISETATDEIEKAILVMDNRKYEPRIMKELFDY